MLPLPVSAGRHVPSRLPASLVETGCERYQSAPKGAKSRGSRTALGSAAIGLLAASTSRKMMPSRQQLRNISAGATLTRVTDVRGYNTAVGGRRRIRDILDEETGGEKLIGETIQVCGWIRSVRSQKTLTFLKINDGSTFQELQIVLEGDSYGLEDVKAQGTGASVRVEGVVTESFGKGQSIEVKCTESSQGARVLGTVDSKEYPLAKKFHSPEFMRTIAHLRPRANLMSAVTRVRNSLAFGTHKFFQERGFLYLNTPILTGSDCEGAGEMFQVTSTMDDPKDAEGGFFGGPVYLTVSGQLSAETYACSLGDVYTFGPTFRAESSNTTRHLAEFWMIEPEMAFADIEDDMQCAEDYLKYCARTVLDECRDDIDFFSQRVDKEIKSRLETLASPEPYARITYTDAVEALKEAYKAGTEFTYAPEWGADLQTEHERWLAEEKFKGCVIVYNYPKDIKAFYMRMNEDEKTVAAMDVLAPGVGEIVGGSQREERLERLDARMEEMGLPKEEYWWYRELRKYGSVPHAGFGLGFERLVMLCTGVSNIRDTIPFPRYKGSAAF